MRLSLPNYTEILVPSRVGIQLSFHRINLPLNKTVIWKINLFDLIEIKYNLIQSVNRLLRSGNAPRASFGKISSAVKSWPLKNQSNWENITPRDATNRILTFKISNNVLGLLSPNSDYGIIAQYRLCRIHFLANFVPGYFAILCAHLPRSFKAFYLSLNRYGGEMVNGFLHNSSRPFISYWRYKRHITGFSFIQKVLIWFQMSLDFQNYFCSYVRAQIAEFLRNKSNML